MSEPKLAGDEIQGDSLAGFRKDHVELVFLRFDEARIAMVKQWLLDLTPRLARLSEVSHFNQSYRKQKQRLGTDPEMAALWINIGFTAQGLRKLVDPTSVEQFEIAFRMGAQARAGVIGDPTSGEGSPSTWKIGGPGNEPDAMVNIAADLERSLNAERVRLGATIAATNGAIEIVYEDIGNACIAPEKGHEHFGFKDGVSQPGVRGTIGSSNAELTKRYIDDDQPIIKGKFAAPGQPLLEPGELVVGYPRQHPENATAAQEPDSDFRTEPDWAVNGSYLVYRRLRQDVAAFERFVSHGVEQLREAGVDVTPELFGAMCVGRWKSGTPIARAPREDDPSIVDDKFAPQSFFFGSDTKPVKWIDPDQKTDEFRAARMDGDGLVCPLAAHIRKVNPRDEGTDVGGSTRTFRRRIMRRAVTYGPKYVPGEKPGIDRGLLFLCYQRSISDQFEFIWRAWSNKTDTPRAQAGFDPIIGQNGDGDPAGRSMQVAVAHDKTVTVTVPERFIISTGGAYLFVPAISAITGTLAKS